VHINHEIKTKRNVETVGHKKKRNGSNTKRKTINTKRNGTIPNKTEKKLKHQNDTKRTASSTKTKRYETIWVLQGVCAGNLRREFAPGVCA
jgi:hypothetical protein